MKAGPWWQGGAALFALALLFNLPGLLAPRDFAAGDEVRYAEVLREMMSSGHALVPTLNGAYYSDKPPVFFWLAALAARLTGQITPFSMMLLSWLSAAGAVWATARLGGRLYGERAGRWGALVLLSTLVFLLCAQIVRMDMPMTCCVVLALAAFQRGVAEGRRSRFLLFYLFAALAVLFKGPLGFLIPFAAAAGFLVQRRRWVLLRQFVVHEGFLLFLLLVGSWLGVAWLSGEREFVRDIWVRQVVGRAVHSAVQRQPFYFYLLLLPVLLLPWSAFLPRALRAGWRSGDDGSRLLLWWLAAGTAIISGISGKLFIYVLPMVPPAALLLGKLLADLASEPAAARSSLRREGVIAAAMVILLAALIPVAAARLPALADFNPWPLAAVLGLTAALVLRCAWQARVPAFVGVLVAALWFFSAGICQVIVPRVDSVMSDRLVAEDLARRRAAGQRVATYRVQRGMCSFYAHAPLPAAGAGELSDWLSAPGGVVMMPRKEYTRRQAEWGAAVGVLADYEVVGRSYVIVGRVP